MSALFERSHSTQQALLHRFDPMNCVPNLAQARFPAASYEMDATSAGFTALWNGLLSLMRTARPL